jgi:hypothetical protein
VLLVDADTVAASPLRERLVLTGGAGPLAASVERGLARLWGFFRPDADEGPGALVRPDAFARALRRLTDSLLAPALATAPGQAVRVDLRNPLWAGLYPELCGGEPASPAAPGAAAAPPRLVVVLGCGRSGTTWLERLLMAHPDAGGAEATESFVFAQAAPLWQEVERPDGLGEWFTRETLAPVLRAFFDDVFAATLERHRPGATVMVEKTPKHVFVIPEIRAAYPDAYYLHLVRDGRDVARSASQVPFFQCPTPADGAALWDLSVGLVRQHCAGLARFRELRYEDAVADPVGAVTALWSWVGLEATPGAETELRARIAPRVSRHAGVAHAVGAASWTSLSSAELAGVYAEAGPRLVGDGYATRADLRRAMAHPAYWQRRRQRSRRVRGGA